MAHDVAADAPEKGGIGKEIQQHIGRGRITEQGQIDGQPDEDRIGRGEAGAEQAEMPPLHARDPGHQQGHGKGQQDAEQREDRTVDQVDEVIPAERMGDGIEQVGRQGHGSDQPGQQDLGLGREPALAGQHIRYRDDDLQAEDALKGVQKNHDGTCAAGRGPARKRWSRTAPAAMRDHRQRNGRPPAFRASHRPRRAGRTPGRNRSPMHGERRHGVFPLRAPVPAGKAS